MMRLALPLLAALACTGCATTQSADTAGAQADSLQGAHYVAMGSSFAAGAGIGPLKEGTPERCGRTQNNYSALLAAELGLDLTDASCGGARTEHLLAPWDDLPAQIDAVTAETRLVTITVGGNDLDYMGLLFSASCDPAEGMVFDGERVECPPRVRLPSEQAYSATGERLGEVAREVRKRAPDAMIVFVQYVTLVPEKACAAIPIDDTAQAEARELAARLADITAQAAERNDALVLPAQQLSANHTACDTESWSRGFPANPQIPGAPWHPTALGHAEIAAELAELLDR